MAPEPAFQDWPPFTGCASNSSYSLQAESSTTSTWRSPPKLRGVRLADGLALDRGVRRASGTGRDRTRRRSRRRPALSAGSAPTTTYGMPIGELFHTVPKSGCRKAPLRADGRRGSSRSSGRRGACEMSVFHGLLAGKTLHWGSTPVTGLARGVPVTRGVGVGVGEGVRVGVAVGVRMGVAVGVRVGVAVGVRVGVAAAVGEGEKVWPGGGLTSGERVGVGSTLGVGLRVGVAVPCFAEPTGGHPGIGFGLPPT